MVYSLREKAARPARTECATLHKIFSKKEETKKMLFAPSWRHEIKNYGTKPQDICLMGSFACKYETSSRSVRHVKK